jgi:hypothetical protein
VSDTLNGILQYIVLTLIGIHALILEAHRRQPPHLSTASFLTVTGLFVAGLVGWIVHWRGDPSRGQSSY